jgi:cell division protein FtsN
MTSKGTAPVRLEILGFNDGKNRHKTQTASSIGAVKEHRVNSGNAYVQIGSFSRIEGAQTYQKRFASLGENYKAVIKEKSVKGQNVFKVLIAGFKSDDEARSYIDSHKGFENAFIIRD